MRTPLMALGTWCLASAAFANPVPPAMVEFTDGATFTYEADPQLDLSEAGTIEFWVGPSWTNEPDYDPVIVASNGPEGPSYLIAMLRGRDGLALVSGEDEAVVAYDFTDSALHHIAIVQLSEGSAVYIDGRLVGALDVGFKSLPASGLWVATSDGTNQPFQGAIGGLRFWGTALEQDVLVEFAMHSPFDASNPHPAIEHLRAAGDFATGELLLIDAIETQE